MNLGYRIKQLRNNNSILQKDLAAKLNISTANLSKYENDLVEPSLYTVNLLADIFNVSTDYLLGRTANKNSCNNNFVSEDTLEYNISTNNNKNITFANRIKELRLENKITQEELGQILKLKRTSISGYESGRIEPPYNILITLSKLFNVTSDYLLGRTDDRAESINFNKIIDNMNMTFEEQELLQIWESLSYENKIILKGKAYELKKGQKEGMEQEDLKKAT